MRRRIYPYIGGIYVDIDRAKQILGSPQKINVKYEGAPIWIEEVYESTNTARVHTENKPDHSIHVRVDELQEQ